jgi:hypothetical protein
MVFQIFDSFDFWCCLNSGGLPRAKKTRGRARAPSTPGRLGNEVMEELIASNESAEIATFRLN